MKVIVLVLVCFIIILSSCASTPPSPVSVHHEWGTLKEVILGSGKDLTLPPWLPDMRSPDPNFTEFLKKYGGMKYKDVNPESAKKVIEQQDHLAKVLESRGVIVHRVDHFPFPEEENYVAKGINFVFPRDPILVIDNNFIEISLRSPFRRKEKFAIRPFVEKFIDDPRVNFVSIPPASPHLDERGPFLEGGDVLLNGYEIYVGNSGVASDQNGTAWLQNYLGPKYKVHEIKLKPDVLHLDCAMALLRPGLGLLYKDGILSELPDSLKGWDWITVTKEEADKLGCNVLILDDKTVIADPQHARIIKEMRKKGVEVIEVPYDEVSKFLGAFRCSHHPLIRESKLK
ncbi:MAG: hypothetical protein KKB81_03350 [Candidatus Margulisbacteria bacterium]|nr:hypothetical protein [Candidatus Margulisiibacteriota bacterium]MBU1022282.1 hypothetical protein [Candidatus Margulisiibacteriota bacterium]MBU1729279.1 hypothetical protein [Candidatus Margulisiibacteriota bacterium]MBU1955552.1 hypothetical protein [Candidatus Margulisiibacteriota bacterium]